MDATQVECPECGAGVRLAPDVVKGEIVPCGECGVEWEVVEGSPWALERAPEEEEDWGE